VQRRVDSGCDKRLSPAAEYVLGRDSEDAIVHTDVAPHERQTRRIPLSQLLQDLLPVEFPRPPQKGVLQVDAGGLQRLFPASEVLTRGFIVLSIPSNVLRRAIARFAMTWQVGETCAGADSALFCVSVFPLLGAWSCLMAAVRFALDEVVGYFDELEDPRSTINRTHPFASVVVIALMAVLAGASGPTTIAQWAEYKEEFLRIPLDLPNGVPRKDVFRRVLSLLRPDAFQACFTTWLESLRDRAAEASQVDRPVYAVDGKTARRSHDRRNGLGALHPVSIWASE
jgi:hypothetical protein